MSTRTSPKAQIIVITTTGDMHLPFVEKHLDRPLVVVDPLSLVEGVQLTYALANHRTVITYGDTVLDNVTSVWLRKPKKIARDTLPFREEFKNYAHDALEQHTRQLYTALFDSHWVSNFYAINQASNKTWQLAVASKLGFRVPDTIFTSDIGAAKAFIEKHGAVIMKPLTPFHVLVDGYQKSMYATVIHKHKLPLLDNLYLSPAIFQQAIDPSYDVRVTVVGDKVFPAIIKNIGLKEDSTVRDWRIGHFEGSMQIEAYENFPAKVADLCVQHVKALGLEFGAIDLVVDKKNSFWFLENNPNGQWGFIERLTNLPIGKAMAELLNQN